MPESAPRRGKLRIFLGYAAGVGKTYRMLEEGRQRKAKGADVVIGYFEPHARPDTIAQTAGLEALPRRTVEYRGARFEEMDTAAILARRPEICLVDEFAHTNVPGSERAKRWEDVLVLLNAGIDVFSNMNIQHLESLNDQVFQITGVRVRETVPDWVIKSADEVVMVDLTATALLNRLQRGVVYPPEKAASALQNFFKESNLAALREIALRQTAHEVDLRQTQAPQVPDYVPKAADGGEAKGGERILALVTADRNTAMLLRRARRVADYLHGECLAVCVADPQRQARVEKHLNFARGLQIETRVLEGDDPAQTVVEFARRHRVTQIFMVRPQYRWWQALTGDNVIHRVVRLARDMQITIVAAHRR